MRIKGKGYPRGGLSSRTKNLLKLETPEIDVGMLPVNWLFERYNDVKLRSCPKSDDRLPENLLSRRDKFSNRGKR